MSNARKKKRATKRLKNTQEPHKRRPQLSTRAKSAAGRLDREGKIIAASARQLLARSGDVYQAADALHEASEQTHLRAMLANRGLATGARTAPENFEVSYDNENDGPRGKPFPIVGVGASAGGFEAFGQLIANLPKEVGMAFVLVQHLDPNHK